MKRRILCFVLTMAMVLSMLVVIPATVASADTFDASANPVIITTDADMTSFQSAVNGGNSFSGKTVKLAGDVALNGTLGATSSKPFSGNFDGQGHTVTITQSIANGDGSGGLFSFVRTPASGTVTIQNVKVTGTITLTGTNVYCAGGVVSCVDGNTSGSGGTINITNVWSDVNITSQTTGLTDRVAGIVAFTRHATDVKAITLNIDSCVYSGTITSAAKSLCVGGIFGGTGNNVSNRNVTLTISNTLFSGSVVIPYNSQADDCAGFIGYPKGNGSSMTGTVNATVKDCIASGTISFTGDWSSQGNRADFGVALSECSGSYAHGYVTNFYYVQNIFYGSTYVPTIGTSSNASKTTKTNADNATNLAGIKALTSSTVTMTDKTKWDFGESNELPIPASILATFPSIQRGSCFDDMTQSEFVISTNEEMAEFAGLVNNGTTFAGKTIKLGADVNLTTTIGATSSKYFSGNFNGQGHTVTITQSLSSPDGLGGLFSMIRVPENGTVTIQNVHVTGTISVSGGAGFVGGLISTVDAGKSGNGGTLNVTNVWNTVRINLSSTSSHPSYNGGFIGFIRHEDGLKPLTVTFESCYWDGTINAGGPLYHDGGFIGYTGNNKAGRTLTINISNSVANGTFQSNVDGWNQQFGMLVGYVRGGYTTNDATAKPTLNVSNVVSMGKATYSKNTGSGSLIGVFDNIEEIAELNMTNLYYTEFARNGVTGDFPVVASGSITSGSATLKTKVQMFNLAASAFSDSSKWNVSEGFPCPAGIVSTFGSVPSSLQTTLYDVTDTFEIGTPAALKSLADEVNAGTHTYAGKTILLTADLDMTGTGFAGIGVTSSYPFSGNINGQGHTVNVTQSLTDPDGNGAFIGFLRIPENGTVTIQNVHTTGIVTCNSTAADKGYLGGIVDAVDAGTSGSGGTLNITNCWSSVRFNLYDNRWYAISGFVGFLRHNSGLKQLTVNIDSCLWDGYINAGPALEASGGLVGYTGNQAKTTKNYINVSNTVVAGQIALNTNWSDDSGLIFGYLKGNGSNPTDAQVIATVENVVSVGKITSSVNITSSNWVGLWATSKYNDEKPKATVNLTNFYYKTFDIPGVGAVAAKGTGVVNGTPVVKTTAEMANLTGSAFSNASKWDLTNTGYPCPASIVTTFGYPASLEVDPYDISDVFNISNETQLRAIAEIVNAGTHDYAGKTVRLTANIELTSAWTPIGVRTGDSDTNRMFCGTFDGQGYTVSNVTTAPTANNRGAFFGYLGNGAVVQNLNLDGQITGTPSGSELYYLASVTNCTKGTVVLNNVHSNIGITMSATGKGMFYSAGLVGFMEHYATNNLTIQNCEYSGTINCTGQTRYVAGIIAYTGNTNSGYTSNTLTITGTVFSGRIYLNDNDYYYANAGIIGGINRAGSSLAVTITDSSVQGRIFFNSERAWVKDGTTSGSTAQIIGLVDDATMNLTVTNVTYYESSHVTVANDSSSKVVIAEVGKWGDTWGYDLPGATVLPFNTAAAAARTTEDTYKGIRFTATFYNTASCTGGGTASANFGIYLLTKDIYDLLGGETATAAQLAGASANGVIQVKATKYQDNTTNYTVNAVVFNLNTNARKATELVAVPYVGNTLGEAVITTYNTLFN